MADISSKTWTRVRVTNRKLVGRYLSEMGKQREHYTTRTTSDVVSYIANGDNVEGWVADGEDYSVGILLMYRPKMFNGEGAYSISNAWFSGNIVWEEAVDILIEKTKEYCERHGATVICHKQFKDLQGGISEATLTYPLEENAFYQKLKENFTEVSVTEEENYFLIVLTI